MKTTPARSGSFAAEKPEPQKKTTPARVCADDSCRPCLRDPTHRGCALLVRLDFTNDVQKVLDVHLQGHSLGEFLSGDAGSRNLLHSRGNLD
jgi:hypothetical protein